MQILRPNPTRSSRSGPLTNEVQESAFHHVVWVILMPAKVWEPLLEDKRIGAYEVSSPLQADALSGGIILGPRSSWSVYVTTSALYL